MSSKLKENLSWSLYLCKDVGFSQFQENSERNWKFWFVDLPGWANQPLLPPISLSLVSIGRRRQQTVARRVVVEYTAIAPWKDCRSSTWAIVLSLFIFIRTEGTLRLRLRPPIDEQLRSKRGEGWGREGGGRSIIKIFWPIDLNNLWSQEICQPKMIVWSGATFILIWSCLILIYLISEGLLEQHLGDVRGQHRPKPRHARAAAHSYRAQGGRVDFGCVLKE